MKTTDNNFFAYTNNGNCQYNEFAVNFNKNLTDKLRMGAQLFAKDLGQPAMINLISTGPMQITILKTGWA